MPFDIDDYKYHLYYRCTKYHQCVSRTLVRVLNSDCLETPRSLRRPQSLMVFIRPRKH